MTKTVTSAERVAAVFSEVRIVSELSPAAPDSGETVHQRWELLAVQSASAVKRNSSVSPAASASTL